jgi:hypothetical protein
MLFSNSTPQLYGWYKGRDKYGVDITSNLYVRTNKTDGTFVADYDTYNGGAGLFFLSYRGVIFVLSGASSGYTDFAIAQMGLPTTYWCSSSAGSGYACCFGASNSNVSAYESRSGTNGCPIRCVKN